MFSLASRGLAWLSRQRRPATLAAAAEALFSAPEVLAACSGPTKLEGVVVAHVLSALPRVVSECGDAKPWTALVAVVGD